MRLNGLLTLKNKKDFQHNKSTGTSFFSRSLVVQISEANNGATNVGFVVSKKVGQATTRNLVKRRLRALAEELLMKCQANKIYVVIARRNSSLVPFHELQRDFFYCLRKYHL